MSEYVVSEDLVINEECINNQIFYKIKCKGRYILAEEWVYKLFELLTVDLSVYKIQEVLLKQYNIVKTEVEIKSTIKYLLSFEILSTVNKSRPSLSNRNEGFFDTMTKLTFKRPILPERLTEAAGRIFSYLFSPAVMVLLLTLSAVFITMTIFKVFQNGSLFNLEFVLNSVANYLPIFLLIVIVSSVLHEFGHIGAAKYVGASVGKIGVGIYFFSPVFYSHLSDINMLKRSKRIFVDTGGIFLDLIVASCISVFALIMNSTILSVFVFLLVIGILYNLLPFTKTDGYWVLSDLTQTTNLHMRLDILISQIIKRRKMPKLSQIKYRFFVIYSVIFLLYFGANTVILILLLPGYIKTYPNLFLKYLNGLFVSFNKGYIYEIMQNVYHFVIILVPVIGLVVLFYKLLKFIANTKRKSTCNK